MIDAIKIPEYAREYCDSWGNLRLEPLTTLDQSRNGDFIQITVYEAAMGYFYGYQLKLKKMILQKKANIKDTPHETEEKARRAARDELLSFVSEKKLMKTFIMFDKICYDQPELF